MTVYVALLRAINLAGHNSIAMADLKATFAKLGFTDARSLLQSGNFVFSCAKRSSEELERLLEQGTAKHNKLTADYFVRTAKEWGEIVAANLFPKEAKDDPGHLVVMALKGAAKAADVAALQAAIKGPETARGGGKNVYLYYPAGIGTSKLTAKVIEKHLGHRGTARNWNTVLKLLALAQARSTQI